MTITVDPSIQGEYTRAYNYLSKGKINYLIDKVDRLSTAKGYGIFVDPATASFWDKFEIREIGKTGIIYWDPYTAIEDEPCAKTLSPALALLHEFAHIYLFLNNMTINTLRQGLPPILKGSEGNTLTDRHEEIVIYNFERPAAIKINSHAKNPNQQELVRQWHLSPNYKMIRVMNSTSHEKAP
jgi:hypothetical protein